MKKFLANRERVFLLILILLSLAKLYHLDGGLVLGEPDEHTHALLTENLKTSPFLQVNGKGWYYGLPLYFYLSYLVSFVFPLRFLALRLVSLLASAALTLGIYLFVKEKVSKEAGFLSALIFLLSPLSIFYSRMGLIEMTVTAFILLFIFSLDRAWEKRNKKLAVLAGLFLGGSILTKYTALPFLFVPLFFILHSSFKNPLTRKGEIFPLDLIPTLCLAVAGLIFVPLAFIIYRHEPFFFRQQLSSVLGGQTGFGFYLSYLRPFVSWLTWPVAILGLIGIYFVWIKRDWRLRPVLAYFLFTSYFIFTRDELVPRYFLALAPFVSVFAGAGLTVLLTSFGCYTNQLNRIFGYAIAHRNIRSGKEVVVVGMVLLLLIFVLPKSHEAFRATQHNVLEEVGQFIKERNTDDRWIFSNYWPPQVGFAAGTTKSTWLANCAWETQAFSSPPAGKSSLDILQEEGGFVVLEEIYSVRLINPACRTEAWDYIRQNYEPVKIFTDTSPNFPFTSRTRNKIEVYEMEK
jgi:hypothetical protein